MPQTKALCSYLQITYKLLHRDHDVVYIYEKSMERNASKTLQYQQFNVFTPTIEIPSRFPKHNHSNDLPEGRKLRVANKLDLQKHHRRRKSGQTIIRRVSFNVLKYHTTQTPRLRISAPA